MYYYFYCLIFYHVFSLIYCGYVGNDTSLRFIVMGDWGGLPTSPFTTPIETGTSKEMGYIAELYESQFVLALGDNFYFNGVTDVHDERFKETYESVYTSPSLYRPWYVIAGNHDHLGNVSAQIQYTRHSHRWNFPNHYYKLEFTIPVSGHTIDIVMIDTVLLCGNTDDRVDAQPTGPENILAAESQWEWIEDQLKSSKAEYLIVCGHYPVYSVAEHGPTDCLVDRLKPLLYKYKVTAYMNGHDHNLQHLTYTTDNHTVQYFVSGSANFIDPSLAHLTDVPKGSLKFHWADILKFGGFGLVVADDRSMTFNFIGADGTFLHKNVMYPRKV